MLEAPHSVRPDVNSPERRRADLRRMRLVATLLLVLMTAIFVISSIAQVDWPWLAYLRAFAEAGMVGACADWFAVVALFRHPLGIPIPHTAIVPANKQRIGPALGRFITNNFLDTRVAHQRLARIDIAGGIIAWLRDPGNTARLARQVGALLPRILKAVPGDEAGKLLGQAARYGIQAVPAAPTASKILATVWAQGEAQTLIEYALDFAEASLANHRDVISRKVAEKSSRWIPKWIDSLIAERVMNGVLASLAEMRDPAHPWRIELRKLVEQLIADLATDPGLYARGEALKAELLENPVFVAQARSLWDEIEHGLYADPRSRAQTVAHIVELALRGFAEWIDAGDGRRARLNRWLRLVILRALLPRRAEIGAYVAQVVENWDTDTLVNRLELQVGKDLQFIRINGTVVGGLVGLMIFVVSRWVAAL